MHTTEFVSASEAAPASELAPANGITPTGEPAPTLTYGPPQWARRSFTGGFAGADFVLQPDGTLRCPANHPLYPQERRPERDSSLRVVYAARIGDCRDCLVRAQCQETLLTLKPRRVSAVFWPLPSDQGLTAAPMLGPPALPACSPVLWGDWPRCHIRRNWLKVVRSETVDVTMGAIAPHAHTAGADEPVSIRQQRAHWRFSWQQRLARNARPVTAPFFTVTIHGLSASFAHIYAFGLLAA